MIEPDLAVPLPERISRVHLAGIGGSGMSSLARLFLELGCVVSGSDRERSYNLVELEKLGARISVGHSREQVLGADTFVYTTALESDNPEYAAAKELGLVCLHRSQALKWLARGRRLVSVAGSHGKTSSTGMLALALVELGADPGFVNGSMINGLEQSARQGGGDIFVIEADESDGSFLAYETDVALITGIEYDHVDHYASLEEIEREFLKFARAVGDRVVISCDYPAGVRLIAKLPGEKVITFGQAPEADVRLLHVSGSGPTCFTLAFGDTQYTQGFDQIFGKHQALNACGVFATLIALGYQPRDILTALTKFRGTKRRLELHATVNSRSVFDDYAHHPAEVEVALAALRQLSPSRIIAVHQPHTFTRTRAFAKDFARVLEAGADFTVVLPVCGAREDPIAGVDGRLVTRAFANSNRCRYFDEWSEASEFVASISRPGDLVVTLGCGDVYRIIPELIDQLRRLNR